MKLYIVVKSGCFYKNEFGKSWTNKPIVFSSREDAQAYIYTRAQAEWVNGPRKLVSNPLWGGNCVESGESDTSGSSIAFFGDCEECYTWHEVEFNKGDGND